MECVFRRRTLLVAVRSRDAVGMSDVFFAHHRCCLVIDLRVAQAA